MATHSKIGWTHHTMNFWWGCHKVSRECRHCYIGNIMRRGGYEPFEGPMRTKNWSPPLRWQKQATKRRERYRIFTCSMSDFFHPGADSWRSDAWNLIRECDELDWLILTKRPELVVDRLPVDWHDGYRNVWLGVTAGCRSSLPRLEILQSIPARLKFVSAEPLVERLDLSPYLDWVGWVITGCERAAKSKRQIMDIDWVRDIDRQCQAADVPHFFKQAYIDEKGVPCESPLLDGALVQEFPESEALDMGLQASSQADTFLRTQRPSATPLALKRVSADDCGRS